MFTVYSSSGNGHLDTHQQFDLEKGWNYDVVQGALIVYRKGGHGVEEEIVFNDWHRVHFKAAG